MILEMGVLSMSVNQESTLAILQRRKQSSVSSMSNKREKSVTAHEQWRCSKPVSGTVKLSKVTLDDREPTNKRRNFSASIPLEAGFLHSENIASYHTT